MEDEELIRQKMEHTRESLTEKLEALEDKVADSVTKVSETVSQVKETLHEGAEVVKGTVHESVEHVKDMFDVPGHFRSRPWMALGGAIAAGYVLGAILPKPDAPVARLMAAASPPVPRQHSGNGNGKHKQDNRASTPAPAAPSMTEGLLSAIKPEIDMLKGLALGATFGTLREMIAREVPPQMGEQIRTIIDGVTKKLGGDPLPGSDFETKSRNDPSDPVGAGGTARW